MFYECLVSGTSTSRLRRADLRHMALAEADLVLRKSKYLSKWASSYALAWGCRLAFWKPGDK